jgi:hypothetical protein
MPDTEISLEEDEVIARVFFRYPSEAGKFTLLRARDFARQMGNHSGISLLRLKYVSKQQVLGWVKSKKLKGLAVCEGRRLIQLGLRFMAGAADAPHVSTRCSPCDLCVTYPQLCKASPIGSCLLDIEVTPALPEILSKEFRVDLPASLRVKE